MATHPLDATVILRRPPLLLAGLLACLLAAGTVPATIPAAVGVPRDAAADDPRRWVPGRAYTGDFPDPSVFVDGRTYVAAATTAENINMPLTTSADLATWVPRPTLPDAESYGTWKLYNDAMPVRPAWAAVRQVRGRAELFSQWAPSIARLRGRYVAAFTAAISLAPRKACIGIATAPTAQGPYTPTSATPLVCYDPSVLGAIDPDIFVEPRTKQPWLLWKNEGVIGVHGPQLVSRKLTRDGTAFAPRSRTRLLMTNTQAWEDGVVENPSMVKYRKKHYLIYSGGRFAQSSYATGYAVCRGPQGPCRKPQRAPILASGGAVEGPGGADAFVDLQGRLRFVYAAWDAGQVGGEAGRRMHVGTLKPVKRGKRLVVTAS